MLLSQQLWSTGGSDCLALLLLDCLSLSQQAVHLVRPCRPVFFLLRWLLLILCWLLGLLAGQERLPLLLLEPASLLLAVDLLGLREEQELLPLLPLQPASLLGRVCGVLLGLLAGQKQLPLLLLEPLSLLLLSSSSWVRLV